MSRCAERATVFGCEGARLVGVLHASPEPRDTGVVVVVGGPQYRAGSHRQFVLLARAIADAGFPVLRFDYRGMGDSEGDPRTFERVSADVRAAIDALQRLAPGVTKVVLWGLCDAASAALLYCAERDDARVVGLALANPWVRTDAGLARTHVKHYYARRLMQPAFWAKVLRGQVGMGAARAFARGVALARNDASGTARDSFQHRMASAWRTFAGPVLLLLSSEDYTVKEFLEHLDSEPAWSNWSSRDRLERVDIAADHTFSGGEPRAAAEQQTVSWMSRQFGRPARHRPDIEPPLARTE